MSMATSPNWAWTTPSHHRQQLQRTGNPSVGARVTPTNAHFTGGSFVDSTITVTLPANVPRRPESADLLRRQLDGQRHRQYCLPQLGGGYSHRCRSVGQSQPHRHVLPLFPYVRNSTSADSSILIANATAVSIYLDILQWRLRQNPQLAAKIDPHERSPRASPSAARTLLWLPSSTTG